MHVELRHRRTHAAIDLLVQETCVLVLEVHLKGLTP
jgi:hypothetical protein